jgi:hypothetical protein
VLFQHHRAVNHLIKARKLVHKDDGDVKRYKRLAERDSKLLEVNSQSRKGRRST